MRDISAYAEIGETNMANRTEAHRLEDSRLAVYKQQARGAKELLKAQEAQEAQGCPRLQKADPCTSVRGEPRGEEEGSCPEGQWFRGLVQETRGVVWVGLGKNAGQEDVGG